MAKSDKRDNQPDLPVWKEVIKNGVKVEVVEDWPIDPRRPYSGGRDIKKDPPPSPQKK